MAWLPQVDPKSEFKDETLTAGGVTAFVGATVFEIGSVLLMLEAINEDREGCFGWALQKVLVGANKRVMLKVVPDPNGCRHHHTNENNLVGKPSIKPSVGTGQEGVEIVTPGNAAQIDQEIEESKDQLEKAWQWWPSWVDLKTHYLRELGFLACLAQFCGATIFWISGFTALPGINNKLSQGALDGIFWVPQIVGGSGFIISGTLFMIETQEIWWKPAFGVLGWHIGFWNLVGAFGFTCSLNCKSIHEY